MTPVLAHGIGGRSDLPVPLWLAVYGGAGVVLISFFVLVAFWTAPRLRGGQAGRPLPVTLHRIGDATGTRVALRVLGLAMGVTVLAFAWFGPSDSARNPAPTWFYVWFWVGLVPLSVLFGPVWRALNPLRTVAMAARAIVPRRWTRPDPPTTVGYWPAVAGLFAFVWIELVYDHADAPRTVALFLTSYAVVNVAAGAVFGQHWFDRGDGFEAYSTLLGHLSPLGRRTDRRLVLRNPLDGLATVPAAPGLVTTVCLLLGSTAFDGLTRTRIWKDGTDYLDRPLYLLAGTAGLVASIMFVVLTYTNAALFMRRHAPERFWDGIEARFVHSLVPIVVGYTVAHYFSFAIFQGQAGYLLLGDADRSIDYSLVSAQAIALVQVGAIVFGHVVAVIAAHDRAVATFDRRDQRAGQYPLLTVMVAYTMGGIALLVGS